MADLFLSSFISDYLTNLPADIHKSLQQIRDFDAIVESMWFVLVIINGRGNLFFGTCA